MISRRNGTSAALVGALWLGASLASAQQPPQIQADEAMQGGGMTEERQLADEQARLHFRAGLGLYDAGRFSQAADEFEEAYRLSGRSQLLFNAYVAFRDASDMAGAVRSLEGYLRETEEVPDRVNLDARLRSMREALRQQESRAALLEENERELAERRREPESGGGVEAWPWIVTAVGGAMVLSGAITGVVALDQADALVASCPGGQCGPRADLDGRRSTAQSLAVTSDVLLFGGGVVAVTGLVLGIVLSVSGGPPPADTPEVSAGCSATGCSATVRARF